MDLPAAGERPAGGQRRGIAGPGSAAPAGIRRPAVAGVYYPDAPAALSEEIDRLCAGRKPSGSAIALVAPHGSYRHAGWVAAAAFADVVIPKRCVLIGPSHAGLPASWGILAGGWCRTPLGDVPVDAELAARLQARCPFLTADPGWHRGEHALEVHLPLLQRLSSGPVSVTAIIMNNPDAGEAERLAEALADVYDHDADAPLLVASTDLSHDETAARAEELDRLLLERLEALDGPGLIREAKERGIRSCGLAAAACVLEAARRVGARGGIRIAYGTSADGGGDPASVTGYGAVVIR
ncbi:MAG TPA: AmmeMemoRadiSam system protein B [bacterium]